jgi:hypothetical protein
MMRSLRARFFAPSVRNRDILATMRFVISLVNAMAATNQQPDTINLVVKALRRSHSLARAGSAITILQTRKL